MPQPLLVISIDLGSSLTKVAWTTYDIPDSGTFDFEYFRGKVTYEYFLVMEPEIIELDKELLTQQQSIGNTNPTNDCWLHLKKNDSTAIAVGTLAQSQSARANLKQLKHESGLYKILAVVGVLAQEAQLSSVDVSLAVLLPYSEWSDRRILQEQVTQHLKSFWYRGDRLQVRLHNYRNLPEGAALGLNHLNSQSRSLAVLMFGHRNLSSLVFRDGQLVTDDSSTSDLGFHQLVKKLQQLVSSGQDSKTLTQLLCKLRLDEDSSDHPLVTSLYQSKRFQDKNQVKALQVEMVKAISLAQNYYWRLVKNWLDSQPLELVDQVVLAGGGASYFFLKEKLTEYFQGRVTSDLKELAQINKTINWLSGLESSHVGPTTQLFLQRQDECLATRLTDVYAFQAHHIEDIRQGLKVT